LSAETALAGGNAGGKRIFFLYPNSVLQTEMVSQLIRAEYEIYLLKDHEKARLIFKKYPDSVVFMNIDDGMKESQWEQYIRELQNDPELRELRIGILTYNNDAELARMYLMDLMVSAGFVKLSLGLKESTEIVLKVLEANEAHGRRKYLRIICGNRHATLNFQEGNRAYTGTVMDISSVGMACTFEPDPQFSAHAKAESIQLKLKGSLCLVSGIVMGTRREGELFTYVLLFDPKTGQDIKNKIRTFIQWSLQSYIEKELEALR
jgi:hypothetical protein